MHLQAEIIVGAPPVELLDARADGFAAAPVRAFLGMAGLSCGGCTPVRASSKCWPPPIPRQDQHTWAEDL